jgi:HEAT repeat protein
MPDSCDPELGRQIVDTLMRLLVDPEPQVRDWATFSLSMTEEDSPQLREALLERMQDTDFNTRSEAAVGLAKRKEPRGIKPLFDCLKSDQVGELYVEAAEMYAEPRLKPALVSLRKWWDVNPDLLERAIAACS